MPKKKKPEKVTYVLTMNEDQAHIVEVACELYARLLIGQFEEITFRCMKVQQENYSERRDYANELLSTCAKIMYGRNIYNQPDVKQTPEHHRAFDIYQVLRYERIKHDFPEETYNSPPFSIIGEPFAKCVIIDEEGCESDGKVQQQEKEVCKGRKRTQNR